MKTQIERRKFLKGSAIASTLLLTGTNPLKAFTGFNPINRTSLDHDHAPLLSSSGNETLKTIHSLRTIHGNFVNKAIPKKDLDIILQAAVQAPNSSGMQTYSIVTITDQDKMEKVFRYKGGALMLFCVDFNRNVAQAEYVKRKFSPDGIQAFIKASTDTILALQTAVIAAKSLGIDSLTTNSVHRGNMQRTWDELELPEKYCFPLIALVLGYPKSEPDHHQGRLQGPGIFHKEKYHLATKKELEEISSQYDDENLHISLDNVWRKDYNHYLEWLHDKWLGGERKPATEESQTFKLLARAGFIDLR